MELSISDNISNQIQIGQRYYQEKKEKYNQRIIDNINKVISIAFPNLTEVDVSDLFFRSVYDYWNYGAKIEEVICYHFFEKTHEEKKKYITLQSRFYYLDMLNKNPEKDVLTDKYETYKRLSPQFKREMVKICGGASLLLFSLCLNILVL